MKNYLSILILLLLMLVGCDGESNVSAQQTTTEPRNYYDEMIQDVETFNQSVENLHSLSIEENFRMYLEKYYAYESEYWYYLPVRSSIFSLTSIDSVGWIDFENNYFRQRVSIDLNNVKTVSEAVIETVDQKIVATEIQEGLATYQLLTTFEQANEIIEKYLGMDLENEIEYSEDLLVSKSDDHTYRFALDVSDILDQTEYQTIVSEKYADTFYDVKVNYTIEFNFKHNSYSIYQGFDSIPVNERNCNAGCYLHISDSKLIKFSEDIEHFSALDRGDVVYQTSTNQEDSMIHYNIDANETAFLQESETNYISYYLETGYYKVNIVDTPDGYNGYKIIDSQGDEVESEGIDVNILESGNYYLVIDSDYMGYIEFNIEKRDYVDIVKYDNVPMEEGTLSGLNESSNDKSYYTFANTTEELALLVIDMRSITDENILQIASSFDTCSSRSDYCYYAVFQQEEFTLVVTGDREINFDLPYHLVYTEGCTEEIDLMPDLKNFDSWNPILLTYEESNMVFKMTIEEGIQYQVSFSRANLSTASLFQDCYNFDGEAVDLSVLSEYPPGIYTIYLKIRGVFLILIPIVNT